MERITERISFILDHRASGGMETGAIVFSKEYGVLGETGNARDLLKKIGEGL